MGKLLIANTGITEYERYIPDSAGAGVEQQNVSPVKWTQAIVGRLREYQLNAVFYLPVSGAVEIADAIASAFSVHSDVLPGFSDAWEPDQKGLNVEEADVLGFPLYRGKPRTDDLKFPFLADIDAIRNKISVSLDTITEKYDKGTVVVVSHRTLTVIMILYLLHMSNHHYNQIAQESGAVNLFEIRSGTPSAIYINDICHLAGLL